MHVHIHIRIHVYIIRIRYCWTQFLEQSMTEDEHSKHVPSPSPLASPLRQDSSLHEEDLDPSVSEGQDELGMYECMLQ